MLTRRTLLPSPALSVALLLLWLLLNGFSVGQLIMGAVVALATPLWIRPFLPQEPRSLLPLVALRLLGVVIIDIIKSNIDVARLIVGPQAKLRPGFVWVPLALRNEKGIMLLAEIITMTPGTLSAEVAADRRHLLVHCLHLVDPAGTIGDIKSRYETPLLALFPAHAAAEEAA